MNRTKTLADFTNLYQLSKTLRFELIPIGKTLEHIESKEILKNDQDLAMSYKEMKKTIDGFHKYFIELAMSEVKLTQLNVYSELYSASPEIKKADDFKDKLQKVQTALRKEIVAGFNSGKAKEIFSNIDKKELITIELERWLPQNKIVKNREEWDKKSNEEREGLFFLDERFKNFTTYFTGFHENRKNMYTDKEQATAIAYRLIHENLPKFLDNIRTYEALKQIPELREKCEILYKNIKEYLKKIRNIDEAFELEYYNEVLTQRDIDVYNLIIGGRVPEEGKTKMQGLNESINLYNQTQDKKNKIPKLKILYKQILSDRDSISFLADHFEESQDVLDAIRDYYLTNLTHYTTKDKSESENVMLELQKLLSEIGAFDQTKIYLRNDGSLTNISQKLFGNYSVFSDALDHFYATVEKPDFLELYKKGNEKKPENLDASQRKFTKQPFVPLLLLQQAVDIYVKTLDETHDVKQQYKPNCISDYFKIHFKAAKKESSDKEFDFISNIDAKYSCIKGVLNSNYPKNESLNQDKLLVGNIKEFLDGLMELLHFVKPLALTSDASLERDDSFYSVFDVYYEQLQLLIPLYNKVKNFCTQKPYSSVKFQLNFENKSKFLDGWVDSHTESSDNATQAGGYLFRKKNKIGEYDYFVGFSRDTKLFRAHLKSEISSVEKSDFERLDYYQLKSASVFGNSYKGESYEVDKRRLIKSILSFSQSKSLTLFDELQKYGNANATPATPSGMIKIIEEKFGELYDQLFHFDEFQKINLEVVDNLKSTILSLVRVPKSQEYKNVDFKVFTEPIKVIESLSMEKSFSYFSVRTDEFEDACTRTEKPLFLFKISNKDLSFADNYTDGKRKIEKRGKDNLHTLYFKSLMTENQNIYDIGTAQVFFRAKSLEYDESTLKKGHHVIELEGKFPYPIISNRRFAFDKFQFHLSMIQNYQCPKDPKSYNEKVLSFLQKNPDINIIGLDRGERHLIYLTLINQKGEILKQETLNSILNEKFKIETNYHHLLNVKENERANARQNWDVIENIKELKEGYISQVVHKIAKMMVEHNAIVVMEDLNSGFKRGRFKVEKQVYQKLEKMLIDKLNYLVFKDRGEGEVGGIYKALQLANKFKSFKERVKQSGFLFYVPAWNTSKIDPTTGFVNLFDTKYESVTKAKDFFSKFDSIRYNISEDYFEFSFDYDNFTTRAEGTRTKWTVCTYGDRIETRRNANAMNNWESTQVVLTEKFKDQFLRNNISFMDGECLISQVVSSDDKLLLKGLLDLLKLTLQMRNSITGSNKSEDDYLISPVLNKRGEFYDSRNADESLPKDADANGAYHIAKKGLMWLNQINNFEGADWKKLDLDKKNKGWLNFVQGTK